MKLFILHFLMAWTILLPLYGQDGGDVEEKEEKPCRICHNGFHHRPHPYHFSIRREVPYLFTGIASLTAAALLAEFNQKSPYTEVELESLDRNDVNAFDRPATYNWDPQAAQTSDYLRTGVLLLPIFFLSNHHTREDFGALLIMGAEVLTINLGMTYTVKNLANRYRPFVYNEEAPVEERTAAGTMLSYYSGHTSHTAAFTFFFAKVINDYHPEMGTGYKIGLWSFAAIIPAVTGYLRFESGKHYPTDIMTGYALGALTGWLVPHLHKKELKVKNLSMTPMFYQGASGLNLLYRF